MRRERSGGERCEAEPAAHAEHTRQGDVGAAVLSHNGVAVGQDAVQGLEGPWQRSCGQEGLHRRSWQAHMILEEESDTELAERAEALRKVYERNHQQERSAAGLACAQRRWRGVVLLLLFDAALEAVGGHEAHAAVAVEAGVDASFGHARDLPADGFVLNEDRSVHESRGFFVSTLSPLHLRLGMTSVAAAGGFVTKLACGLGWGAGAGSFCCRRLASSSRRHCLVRCC